MALDHAQAAKELLEAVGGPENIVSYAHCATRMRLVIADDSKVDKEKVENAVGAKGNFTSAGQLQVIYGTGTVNKVYDEFVKQSGLTASSKDEAKAAAAAKGNPIQQAAKLLGDVFVPIIPAIVASGLLMGLTEGINNAMGGALGTNAWWILIHAFSNASFVFLQILIGFSAARVFGGNEYLGGVIGMIMNHTSLMNAWSIPGAQGYLVVGSQQAATTLGLDSAAAATSDAIMAANYVPQVQLFGFYNVNLQGYQGHVIPVVIAVLLMCYLEKWLHKHVPDMIDLFVTPLVTVLVTGLATMTVIGPVFSLVENGIMVFFRDFLLQLPFGVGGAITGALYPLTVVLGVHHMFNALEAGLCATTPPMDNFNPIISCCNVAQGAACLAVFLKTKSAKRKELALPSGLSGFLGITEPAISGVNLPLFKPFVGALIGAAAGGLWMSLMGVYSTAYGITGLFGFLIVHQPVQYAIGILIAGAISIVVTFSIFKDPEGEGTPAPKATAEAKAAADEEAVLAASEAEAAPAAAATPETIVAPMAGKAIALTDVADPVFASEAMGKGMAIEPTEGKVYAPVDGTITVLAETGHAVGLLSDDGAEILLHIGIDTVELKGEPFTAHVKQMQEVKKGDLLMDVDLAAVKAAGKATTTMVIITNTDDYASVDAHVGADVAPGDAVIDVK